MIVYQLCLSGFLLATGGKASRYSRKVFADKAAAEAFLEGFVERCCDEKDLFCLDRSEPIERKMIELEFVDV